MFSQDIFPTHRVLQFELRKLQNVLVEKIRFQEMSSSSLETILGGQSLLISECALFLDGLEKVEQTAEISEEHSPAQIVVPKRVLKWARKHAASPAPGRRYST